MGIVRSGDFRNGTPMQAGHRFGNLVGEPEPFGNIEPQPNDTLFENQVTWTVSPAHFGNQVSFSLQTVPPVVVIPAGSSGTTDINLTNLLGSNSATLTYYGAPSGVTVAFGTNPDTGLSVATITVGSNVASGRYTITVVGTISGANIETTNIQLVVTANPNPPVADFIVQADGASLILLVNGIDALIQA
jgi:hypothetical protein